MISRYTRPEMGELWSQEARFDALLEVEKSVASVQAEMGMIPKAAAQDIQKKSKFSVKRIEEIEKRTKHDVIAFVSNVAENVGKNGRFLHFGMTSSDALDTALSVQVSRAYKVLRTSLLAMESSLKSQALKHKSTMCAGRTHGMHAEPTTFGWKLAGHWAELRRSRERIDRAIEQMKICKLSGAVGTYSFLTPQLEKRVAKKLKLTTETVATQVIPRDRHAELFNAFSLYGAGLERLAVELRHLQRTEVGEVFEGFSKGQKGSSAMPHKKNPISSENITGAARLLRSYSVSAQENIALWHERDISHSSVERVIFPDAFILLDYAAHRMAGVITNLQIDKERIRANMDLSQGQLFSSHLLLALVDAGLSREDAYAHIQRCSHSLKKGEHLREAVLGDSELKSLIKSKDVEEIFSGKRHIKNIEKQMKSLFSERG